ncbi:hypothetical protein [Gordonia sp. N1V]|uniref:hypothetical protein n=1 Tax=Gordonia sp. N1V TaxID=3034163 RepID=UPI0023E17A35|nr:hypothetical protein [Gordonia sp. N1V]MDF3285024.1 hypothetical protein [Gordonia sp. N1V]
MTDPTSDPTRRLDDHTAAPVPWPTTQIPPAEDPPRPPTLAYSQTDADLPADPYRHVPAQPYPSEAYPPAAPPVRYFDPRTAGHQPLSSSYDTSRHEGGPYDDGSGGYPAEPYGPRQDSPRPAPPGLPRREFDPGVALGQYVGSAVVTLVVAGLVGYLGAILLNWVIGLVPARYWPEHALSAPVYDPATAAMLAGASAIVAAAIMWLLLKITARTGMFFSALTALAAAIGFLSIYQSGPWQTTLGPAVLFVVVAAVIGVCTTGYTRFSTTTPERY